MSEVLGGATGTPRWRIVQPVGALTLLALTAGCAPVDDRSPIPSQMLTPPPAGYEDAAEHGRTAARDFITEGNLAGLSVAVGVAGEVVWSEGFGWANLEREEPVTPETLFRVGRASKALTSAAVGLLYQQGRIDLDAPVQDYLPDFPESEWPVTTRQLMGHVAGVRNYRGGEHRPTDRCEDVVEGLEAFAGDELLFEPGARYRYSNHGWSLVSAVIQAAAGEPFLDFMQREVFASVGMEHTIPEHADEDTPERARFYNRSSFKTLSRSPHVDNSCRWAAEGFLSTPEDLVRFGLAMLNHELLESETVELFWERQVLHSGQQTSTGLGWAVTSVQLGEDTRPSQMVWHDGRTIGGRATLMIFPEHGVVVGVTANVSGVNIASVARRLADVFRIKTGASTSG